MTYDMTLHKAVITDNLSSRQVCLKLMQIFPVKKYSTRESFCLREFIKATASITNDQAWPESQTNWDV